MGFQPGDYVVYGCKGVHRILERTVLSMSGLDGRREYYVMQPCEKPEGSVYAPVDTEKTHMRRIMTREEARQLICSALELKALDLHNRKQLEEVCKESIRSCVPKELLRVIKTLQLRKKERLQQGKKMTLTDLHYLEQAEGILYTELSITLGIPRNDIPGYMKETIQIAQQQ